MMFDLHEALCAASLFSVFLGLIWLIIAAVNDHVVSAVVAAVFIIAMVFVTAGLGGLPK